MEHRFEKFEQFLKSVSKKLCQCLDSINVLDNSLIIYFDLKHFIPVFSSHK
jgi:hypothetical protein